MTRLDGQQISWICQALPSQGHATDMLHHVWVFMCPGFQIQVFMPMWQTLPTEAPAQTRKSVFVTNPAGDSLELKTQETSQMRPSLTTVYFSIFDKDFQKFDESSLYLGRWLSVFISFLFLRQVYVALAGLELTL